MRHTHASLYVPRSIRETTLCSYTGAPRKMEGEIDGAPQIELLPRPTIHRRTFRRDVDETKIYLVTGRNRGILNEEFLDLVFFLRTLVNLFALFWFISPAKEISL